MSEATMEQKDAQIKHLAAQLEAHKQMLNEQLQAGVNLRTNVVLFQQNCHEANVKNEKLTTEIEVLKKEVEALNLKLAEVPAPVEVPDSQEAAA